MPDRFVLMAAVVKADAPLASIHWVKQLVQKATLATVDPDIHFEESGWTDNEGINGHGNGRSAGQALKFKRSSLELALWRFLNLPIDFSRDHIADAALYQQAIPLTNCFELCIVLDGYEQVLEFFDEPARQRLTDVFEVIQVISVTERS